MRRFQYAIGESGIYQAVTEFDAGTVRHHHAFGPGVDEPVLRWDVGSIHLLHADERGSIVAQSDGSGNVAVINRYDEYGIPGPTNAGRFLYTGQLWLPELGLQYSKARIYSPTLGRFLQTDPIGYEGGMNMYAYVHNDPIGRTDPSGMIDRSGISGDDMSRFIDFTPQGSGFSSGHSYDWMGQAATFTSGRIDSQILTNASSAWFKLNRLSERSGVDVGCLLTCSNAAIAATIPQSQGTADILTRACLDGNEIVVTGRRPKLAQNQIPPGQFGLLEWMWEQHKAGARQIRRDVEERCSGDINGGQVVVDGATGAMKSGATAIVRGRPPVPSAARGGAFGVTKSLYTQKCGGR